MQVYSVGAFLKFIVGVIITVILYKYVNVYDNPMLGLGFGFLGIFMMIRGLSYFLFLGLYKLRSSGTLHEKQTSFSYKLSLILAICMMVNLALMINDKWTNIFGLITIAIFVLTVPLLAHEKKPAEITY